MFCRAWTLVLLSVALSLPPARADDTDIYINSSPPPGTEPLVMFSLDYRSNLTSTVCPDVTDAHCEAASYFRSVGLASDLPDSGALVLFDILRLSLKLVLSEISGVKVGLMLNHAHSSGCVGDLGEAPTTKNERCSNGGAILMGFEPLVPNDANGVRTRFGRKLAALKALKSRADSADHSYQGKELFFEFFRYLTGQDVYNGYNGWTDFEQGNAVDRDRNMACGDADPLKAEACYDRTIISDGRYRSPLSAANACTRIFTINFMFQVSQQDDDSDAAITASAAAGGLDGVNLSGNQSSFDTVVEYLHDRDLAADVDGAQNVISYFIVAEQQVNTKTNGYARAGGTQRALPMGERPGQLVDTLRSVLKEILSVSTTFVAASIPVNVFNRAAVVDNVYIALFQADAEARPFWRGNVKKLKLREARFNDGSGDARLLDARNEPAVAADGRLRFDALTWWTDASLLTDSDPERRISAGSDGRHVDRGGAGQKIPGYLSNAPTMSNAEPGARQLLYDRDGELAPLDADLDTATALRSALGAANDAEALATLEWIRGRDVDNVDAPTAARPWLMGDPLHSRPLPINYGALGGHSAENPAIYIAVGGNDGFMRLIRNTASDSTELGEEVWAFMPQKVMHIQKQLRSNGPLAAPLPRHPYGVDGSPAVYQDEASGRVWLFFGLRRGGDAYYALDISDPLSPRLMWSIDASNTGFGELGLSFATPQVGQARNAAGATRPIVVFTGGYDPKKDYEHPASADRTGNAIYVVDAATGALIWKAVGGTPTGPLDERSYAHARLVDSIPSDPIVVDSDGDGLSDRILVGDSSGRVWRADLAGEIDRWKLTLLADLGYHTGGDRAADRRFFHAPDLVQSIDAQGAFDAVLLGSGDRENPLDYGGAPTNFAYMIKDRNIAAGAGTDMALRNDDLTDITDNSCLIRATAQECDIDLESGWKLRLGAGGSGEKSLAPPVTFGGVVYFTTYLPPGTTAAETCGPTEGSGQLYAVSLADGAPAFNFNRADDQAGDTSGLANTLADRADPLASTGIPSQIVFLPGGDSGLSYIRPDLDIEHPPRSNRFRTFWQRAER